MLYKSFVFVSNEKYYLIYFDESDVYIDAYKFEKDRLTEAEVEDIVKEYFRFYRDLSIKDKKKYIYWLMNKLQFDLPERIFSYRFIRYFIVDLDPYFVYQDRYAKHFVLDFEAIKNKKRIFFKQPKLFPFYISYFDVWIKEDYKIYKDDQIITQRQVFELDKEFRGSLVSLIVKKDKIYSAITKRLIQDFYRQKRFLDSQKVCDYNLEMEITIFDIAGNILFRSFYDESFEEGKYKLSFLELNVDVGTLLYWVISKFGVRAVTKKINIWCEVKSDLQMFYKV